MQKFTCLVLLVAVAVSWSHVDAKPNRFGGISRNWNQVLAKRQISSNEIDGLSEGSQEKLAKQLLAGLLLLTVDSDNSAEVDRLTLEFKKAVDKKWDSIDDFATHLAKVYEDVTGRKLDASPELE